MGSLEDAVCRSQPGGASLWEPLCKSFSVAVSLPEPLFSCPTSGGFELGWMDLGM